MFEMVPYLLGITGLVAGLLLLWHIPYCAATDADAVTEESVSIIIPARNEAETLPNLLGSIRSQTGVTAEVIVVDDHSTDETAKIADSYGAVVISSEPLPDGWVGKTWACFQGARRATGDVLIFLDADTFLNPGGLRRMLYTFSREPGVVSVAPYHVTKKLHEQFSAVFNIIVASSVNAFSLFRSQRATTGLFGPCLMVSREDYHRIGGHESVKGRILENLFMAEKFAEYGIEMVCYGGKGVLSYRMYPDGIDQVVSGWGKVFVSGARQTKWLTTLLISVWFAGNVTVPVSLIPGTVVFGGFFTAVMLMLYCCFAAEHYWMLRRIGSFSVGAAVLFPVTVGFFLFVFIVSMIRNSLGYGVQWKGRTVSA